MPYIQMKVEDVKQFALGFNKDLIVVLTWDQETNTTNILTYGSNRKLSNGAHATGTKLAKMLNLKNVKLEEDRRSEHTS